LQQEQSRLPFYAKEAGHHTLQQKQTIIPSTGTTYHHLQHEQMPLPPARADYRSLLQEQTTTSSTGVVFHFIHRSRHLLHPTRADYHFIQHKQSTGADFHSIQQKKIAIPSKKEKTNTPPAGAQHPSPSCQQNKDSITASAFFFSSLSGLFCDLRIL
jgi:hypothetical protein